MMGDIKINEKLLCDIINYCELNNITDKNEFINKIIKKGFNIEKYGDKPSVNKKSDTTIKEVVKTEVIIEKQDIVEGNKVTKVEDKTDIYDE